MYVRVCMETNWSVTAFASEMLYSSVVLRISSYWKMRHIATVILFYLIGAVIAWVLNFKSTLYCFVLGALLYRNTVKCLRCQKNPVELNTSIQQCEPRWISLDSNDWNQVFSMSNHLFCLFLKLVFNVAQFLLSREMRHSHKVEILYFSITLCSLKVNVLLSVRLQNAVLTVFPSVQYSQLNY